MRKSQKRENVYKVTNLFRIMKKQIKAVSAIIKKDGKILLIKRGKNPWKDMWGTSGGKIDEGETPNDAIIREINEELSVKFYPIKKIKTYHFEDERNSCDTIVFFGKIDGEIKIKKDEISELKWLPPKEALSLPLASTNRERILDFIGSPPSE